MFDVSIPQLVVTTLVLSGALWLLTKSGRPAGLPPGPAGLPIIGNALQLPSTNAYKVFARWGREYGPVIAVKAFSRTIIVINSAPAAANILSKTSASTSFRIVRRMAELSGFGLTMPHLQPNAKFRQSRIYTNKALGPTAMKTYECELERRASKLVRKLSAGSHDLQDRIQCWVATNFEHIAYGTDDEEDSSGFVELGRQGLRIFVLCSDPMVVWPVDIVPFLQYLPSWLPGMGFKRKADDWRRGAVKDLVDRPFEGAVRKMENGNSGHCLVSRVLGDQSPETFDPQNLEILKYSAVNVYLGGFDTMTSIVCSFFLSMILHPTVQKRGQAEVDAVTQRSRLPTFADRPSLPYVDCIVKELIRWALPTPLVFPHVQDPESDTSVDGWFIPRGSMILVNTCAIMQDANLYEDPLDFRPERFLDNTLLDPLTIAFGYGRRQCIGMHFVERCLWITIATTLATLDVRGPTDPGARQPRAEWTGGPLRYRPLYTYLKNFN